MGWGALRRDVKGQVLDPSRSLGMTVMQRSRHGASSTGCTEFPTLPAFPIGGLGVTGWGLGVEEFLGGGVEVWAEVWVGDVY